MTGYTKTITYSFEANGKWYEIYQSGDEEVWVSRVGAVRAGVCFSFEHDGSLYAPAHERHTGRNYGYDMDVIESHLNAYPLPWLQEA